MKNTTLLAVSNDLDRIIHNIEAFDRETIASHCEAMQRALYTVDTYIEELEAELAEHNGPACDRCGAKLVEEGYWSDMAERGACATDDGGVLCPKCFGEEPLANPETGYIMTRSELNEDDAAQFTGDYVVFDPHRGAFSFDRLEEAEAFLHGDDEVPAPGPVEPEGHVCEVCELDLVRRGDIVGMPHRQLHVTEGGTELCPECYGLYLQGDDA